METVFEARKVLSSSLACRQFVIYFTNNVSNFHAFSMPFVDQVPVGGEAVAAPSAGFALPSAPTGAVVAATAEEDEDAAALRALEMEMAM